MLRYGEWYFFCIDEPSFNKIAMEEQTSNSQGYLAVYTEELRHNQHQELTEIGNSYFLLLSREVYMSANLLRALSWHKV